MAFSATHEGLLQVTLGHAKSATDGFQGVERFTGSAGVLHRRVQRHALIGQKRGVRSEDAVPGAQADQLVDQLPVLARHVDLVDQVADPPGGPDPLDELMGTAPVAVLQLGRKLERPALAADLPGDPERCPARLAIPPYPDDLAPFKQVGQVAGIGPVHVDARQLDVEVGQDRTCHLRVEPPHVGLDVLIGLDVLAGPAVAPAQPVEQPGVDVESDAEAE